MALPGVGPRGRGHLLRPAHRFLGVASCSTPAAGAMARKDSGLRRPSRRARTRRGTSPGGRPCATPRSAARGRGP
jgi:hypothetical protein